MFGIIATIIAAKKGHKTFAWVVGIWSVIEIVMLLAKSPYAVGPGGLFVLIAIGMKNLNKSDESTRTDKKQAEISNTPSIDTACQTISSGDSGNKDISAISDVSTKSMNIDDERGIPDVAPSYESIESEQLSNIESTDSSNVLIADFASPRVRYCRKCGFQLLTESDFCSHCGTKVIEARQA